MLTISFDGQLFNYDADARMWWPVNTLAEGAMDDARILTHALDPSGPGGEIPDHDQWALEQVRRIWPGVEVVAKDDPPVVPEDTIH